MIGLTRLKRLVEDWIEQRIQRIHTGFYGIVLEYLGPVDAPTGRDIGISILRMVIQPDYRKLDHLERNVILPRRLSVPVNNYTFGNFIQRRPFAVGQTVWVEVHEREIHRLVMDHEIRHPGTSDWHTLNGATVSPETLRYDVDPKTPQEAFDADYFAVLGGDGLPVAKHVRTPDGKFITWCPEWTLHCPKIYLGAINDLEAIRIRVDEDDDTEKNGPDIHHHGSKCTFIATDSDYRPGLTEPLFYQGAQAIQDLTGARSPNSVFAEENKKAVTLEAPKDPTNPQEVPNPNIPEDEPAEEPAPDPTQPKPEPDEEPQGDTGDPNNPDAPDPEKQEPEDPEPEPDPSGGGEEITQRGAHPARDALVQSVQTRLDGDQTISEMMNGDDGVFELFTVLRAAAKAEQRAMVLEQRVARMERELARWRGQRLVDDVAGGEPQEAVTHVR